MKKWMIFMRESDGTHFLYNGEGCIRVSPIDTYFVTQFDIDTSPRWHHNYGELPDIEWTILKTVVDSRQRGFELIEHGRYQVIARGVFKEL